MMLEKKRTARKRSTIESVEKDFHEALDRLIAGKPRTPRLKRHASEGRLNINPTTVALEAGHSRTLIAVANCRLPSVRNRIIETNDRNDIAAPRTASEVITKLREQVIDLKRQLGSAIEAQAGHFLAREKAERESEKWRHALKRESDHTQQDAKVRLIRPSIK
jgi:hypothetical protein